MLIIIFGYNFYKKLQLSAFLSTILLIFYTKNRHFVAFLLTDGMAV